MVVGQDEAKPPGGADRYGTPEAFVEALQRKESEAWQALIDRCWATAISVLATLGIYRQDAEDVAQEGVRELIRVKDTLRINCYPWAFYIATCKNRGLDFLRIKGRSPPTQTLDSACEVPDRAVASDPVDLAEMSDEFWAAFASLAEHDRNLLRWSALEELDSPEIAGRLGVSVEIVYKRLHRAKVRLREALDRVGYHPGRGEVPLGADASTTSDGGTGGAG